MQRIIREEEYEHESRPNYIRQETSSSSSPPQRKHATDGLPYKCGVVFFYHIPSTGGGELREEVQFIHIHVYELLYIV